MIEIHELKISCLKCRTRIRWAKVNFLKDNGLFDWRLDVWCGCGEVKDPEILEMVEKDYKDNFRREGLRSANEFLDSRLGEENHALLEFEVVKRRMEAAGGHAEGDT